MLIGLITTLVNSSFMTELYTVSS